MPMRPLFLAIAVLLTWRPVANAEMIINSGFETGNFSGWTISGTSTNLGVDFGITHGDVHSGSSAAWFGALSGITYISQTLATIPGQAYFLSFWGENVTPDSPPPQNHIEAWWGGTQLLDGGDVPVKPWSEGSAAVVASGSLTELKLGFQNGPGYWVIDDVSATPVPEPGGVSLWAVGFGLLAPLSFRWRCSR